ncbi:MAG TPA: bifunctional pyr operon transcriptional regulator/uracil phosphoribosyltransferase PyrR [Humisphaera sp.]
MRTDYDDADVRRLIAQLADQIAADFPASNPINVVGIRTRGEVLAHRLVEHLGDKGYGKVGRGVLDITLYRDDLSEIGPRPLVRPSQLAIQVDGVPLLLVDDVIFTGRSVRAALNLLNDFGRPSAIRLAVLVDRGGRELPIQPDYTALTLPTVPLTHKVSVKLIERDGTDGILVERRG